MSNPNNILYQKPPMPAIFCNTERLRRFKLATPGWQYLPKEQLRERFDEFCKTYDDPTGVVRLGTIKAEDRFIFMR